MWQKSVIDGVHAVAQLLRAGGTLRTAARGYYDPFEGDLKYARCGLNCNAARNWKKVTVASTGDVGVYPSMVVEPNNRVHVSYYGATSSVLFYATCTTDCLTASGWTRSVLDGFQSVAGEYPSLVVRNGVAGDQLLRSQQRQSQVPEADPVMRCGTP